MHWVTRSRSWHKDLCATLLRIYTIPILNPRRLTKHRHTAAVGLIMTFHEHCDSSLLALEWVSFLNCVLSLRDATITAGPLIGRWNFFLERHFPLRTLGGSTGKVSLRALARRVGADQLFM